jgi:hypothetical protein
MVRSAQTMHQSCVKIRTISKGTKSSYHLSLVTLEYHRLRLKWFMGLHYVWRNPCNYLAPTPTLSLNGTKWGSTWPTLPWTSIGCIQNNFRGYGMFGPNRAPILHQDWHYLWTDWIELPLEPRLLGIPSGASKMISEPKICLSQTMHLSCTDTNTVSERTETRFHMPCHLVVPSVVQNDFWASSMFCPHCAPILRQE